MNRQIVFCAALAFGMTAPVVAQTLGARINSAPEGTATFHFASRPGVCGDGNNISFGRSGDKSSRWWRCEEGPVRVALAKDRGGFARLRTIIGSRDWEIDGTITDLGEVSPTEAAAWLLDLAGQGTRVGDGAIGAAVLANGVTLWPDLLRLAKNNRLTRDVRRAAVFWLSQDAAESAVQGLADLVDDDEDRELRKHAVFALSQLPRDQGVPILIRTARNNRDPEVRRQAVFWLGQSEDPRALVFFEELLRGG